MTDGKKGGNGAIGEPVFDPQLQKVAVEPAIRKPETTDREHHSHEERIGRLEAHYNRFEKDLGVSTFNIREMREEVRELFARWSTTEGEAHRAKRFAEVVFNRLSSNFSDINQRFDALEKRIDKVLARAENESKKTRTLVRKSAKSVGRGG